MFGKHGNISRFLTNTNSIIQTSMAFAYQVCILLFRTTALLLLGLACLFERFGWTERSSQVLV